ncbi:MAG: threonylcarbamoyl-AMP synthase [Anaerolineae bacterium]|nr:threonylcarbamoyl-AMP synthase [Anaerolineae bacterium]
MALANRFFPAHRVALHRDLAGWDRVLEIQAAGEPPGRVGEAAALILPADVASVAFAAEALRRGEVVAFPTDTVYGVGAALFHERAIRALYEIKGRPEAKAIPLLLADPTGLERVAARVPPLAERLVQRFWPGGLTLVVEARPELPEVLLGGGRTVAVRVPDHPIARALIRAVGAPLATTSANRSGEPEALTAAEVIGQLGRGVRWVIDGGRSPGGKPSTVVDLSTDPPVIRRVGAIPADELLPVLMGAEGAPPRER